MLIDVDIFSFLKADQYARAFEKEEDKVPRAKERKMDREHMLAVT